MSLRYLVPQTLWIFVARFAGGLERRVWIGANDFDTQIVLDGFVPLSRSDGTCAFAILAFLEQSRITTVIIASGNHVRQGTTIVRNWNRLGWPDVVRFIRFKQLDDFEPIGFTL